MKIKCAFCGHKSDKATSAVNRAARERRPLYCNRLCAGAAKRKHKTTEQKKSEKSAYDAQRRIDLADQIKAKKAAYHKRTYDKEKARKERKAKMHRHIEYCRRPEYREWKSAYDREYRAKKCYGPMWEAFLLALDIRNEVLSQMSDYEIRLSKGTINKRLQRKREYEQARSDRPHGQEPQVGPLGNLARGQERKNGSQSG